MHERARDDPLCRPIQSSWPGNADENRGTGNDGHFRMTHLVLLAIGHGNPERLEWFGAKQLENVVRPHQQPPWNRNTMPLSFKHSCHLTPQNRVLQGRSERIAPSAALARRKMSFYPPNAVGELDSLRRHFRLVLPNAAAAGGQEVAAREMELLPPTSILLAATRPGRSGR